MKIHVPVHAEIRLVERGIDIDNVKKVIQSPSSVVPQDLGRVRATKDLQDGRILSVIYRQERGQFVIIAAYYES